MPSSFYLDSMEDRMFNKSFIESVHNTSSLPCQNSPIPIPIREGYVKFMGLSDNSNILPSELSLFSENEHSKFEEEKSAVKGSKAKNDLE